MGNFLTLVAVVAWIVISATSPVHAAQAASPGIEQQLRAQYPITIVGNNGVVVKTGTILVVQQDGVLALQAPSEWPCNTYKANGRIKQAGLCGFNYAQAKANTRALQVGEKVYLTAIQAKPTEIAFKVQSITQSEGEVPVKAAVSFQFQKGSLDAIKVKDVQDTVSQIFVPDTGAETPGPASPPPDSKKAEPPASPLTLPAVFVSAKTPANRLQLNADNSFSLTESGQKYHGTFVVSGNTLELNLTETGTKTSANLQGKQLTDSGGQVWALSDQRADPTQAQNVLQNQDVIELVKNGIDDATILATIANSKCQFDTSTNALIKLKQSKVSPAVLKAMVAAPK